MTKVLVVVAHPDDEVLMCGGSIALHSKHGDEVFVLFISEGVTSRDAPVGSINARLQMASKASDILGYEGDCLGWADQKIDTYPQLELNRAIESVVEKLKPEIVYTHWDKDVNLDHALVSRACMVACRSVGTIHMGYGTAQWINEQRGFIPNAIVDITEVRDLKLQALECYKDELGEVEFSSAEVFEAVVFQDALTTTNNAIQAVQNADR